MSRTGPSKRRCGPCHHLAQISVPPCICTAACCAHIHTRIPACPATGASLFRARWLPKPLHSGRAYNYVRACMMSQQHFSSEYHLMQRWAPCAALAFSLPRPHGAPSSSPACPILHSDTTASGVQREAMHENLKIKCVARLHRTTSARCANLRWESLLQRIREAQRAIHSGRADAHTYRAGMGSFPRASDTSRRMSPPVLTRRCAPRLPMPPRHLRSRTRYMQRRAPSGSLNAWRPVNIHARARACLASGEGPKAI